MTDELIETTARAIIAAKVAYAEAKGYQLTAEAFFEQAITYKQEFDAAIDVVIAQAREISRLKRGAQ